jgi:hypothetical protein
MADPIRVASKGFSAVGISSIVRDAENDDASTKTASSYARSFVKFGSMSGLVDEVFGRRSHSPRAE